MFKCECNEREYFEGMVFLSQIENKGEGHVYTCQKCKVWYILSATHKNESKCSCCLNPIDHEAEKERMRQYWRDHQRKKSAKKKGGMRIEKEELKTDSAIVQGNFYRSGDGPTQAQDCV